MTEVSPVVLSIISEGLFPMPEGTEAENERLNWRFFMDGEEKEKLFAQCKEAVLAEWIRERPGTRPDWWWKREPPEKCRRRLGGAGDPIDEHLRAYGQIYEHGIPTIFVGQWDCDYYNGRARDVHGNKIQSGYKQGDFRGLPIDPEDPPRYESEAAFLKRHGLLMPGETHRLGPEDFEPELVLVGE